MVEFVSTNPTGPLHVGHGRGAAYGDGMPWPGCCAPQDTMRIASTISTMPADRWIYWR
jgi:hypothetical protein